jgi:HTTM domain
MSIVGILYIRAYWHILLFVWSPYSPQMRQTASWICACLIALLLVRLSGLGPWWVDRIVSILHCAGISWLFSHTFPCMTANEELYVMLAFWMCFVQLNPGRHAAPAPAWPAVLLGINVGVYFLTAGIDKYCDPLWSAGTGLYHALLMPWLRSPRAEWLLDCRWGLTLMNYIALAMELAVLPLLFLRNTRWLACVLMFLFFGMLMWPMRLDMIGPVGLCLTLAVWAGAGPALRLSRIGWGMLIYTLLCSVHAITAVGYNGKLDPGWITANKLVQNVLPRPARWFNEHLTYMIPKKLFSERHTVGMWAFRILVQTPDGRTVEPIRIFEPDKSGGPDTRSLGSIRQLQVCMYNVSSVATRVADRQSPTPSDTEVIDALLMHALRLAGGRKARLFVSPIWVPKANEGNTSLWSQAPWIPLRSYSARSQRCRWLVRPNTDLSQRGPPDSALAQLPTSPGGPSIAFASGAQCDLEALDPYHFGDHRRRRGFAHRCCGDHHHCRHAQR